MILLLRALVFLSLSWLGISAGHATSFLELISSQTPSGTGVVSFTSIPTFYRHLYITIVGRGTTAAASVNVNLIFNSDTGNNYDYNRTGTINGTSGTTSTTSAAAAIVIATVPGSTATASNASTIYFYIPLYNGTTFNKTAYGAEYTPNVPSLNYRVGAWRNTAAITRIDLTLASGNYVSGSVINLFGMY